MSKKQTTKNASMLARIPKEILAALIVGGLGFVGVLATALVSYLVAWVPITATQTAIVELTQLALVSQARATTTPQTVLPTAMVSTPTIQQAGGSATPTLEVQEIIRVAELVPGHSCYKKIFPPDVDPLADPLGVLRLATQARDDGSMLFWYYTPAPDKEMVVIYSFTHIASANDEWVIIEKYADAMVKFRPSPDIAHSFDGGCGGGGLDNPFTPLELNSNVTNAKLTTQSQQFDYFSLQPGETARFAVPFMCRDPGMYDISLRFTYTYHGITKPVDSLGTTRVMCPSDFVEWSIYNDELIQGKEYFYADGTYSQK